MAGSSSLGLLQSPSNQTPYGPSIHLAPQALNTSHEIVSMLVSVLSPRITAPATSPPESAFTLLAMSISSSIVSGSLPPRYLLT